MILRRAAAEALGTALLAAAVVGSGIMAERLARGEEALALLANAIATGCALFVLIEALKGASGAHFNPVVTAALALARRHPVREIAPYVVAQLLGALAGVLAAHAMFDLPLVQLSGKARTGAGQWLAEAIATFGLVFVVLRGVRTASAALPAAVAAYITAAYWFTASTSFANPALTVGRALSGTFSGIAPEHAPAFVLAQFGGAAAAWAFERWLSAPRADAPAPAPRPLRTDTRSRGPGSSPTATG
ncbi:MAG: aquaporin [Burkholderiales bacterium]|nr:aquaporin [Burkholderiales bacterium]